MRGQRGFALLMVLWVLVLLAYLATSFGSNVRTDILLARNLMENAQAEALADGGIYRAIADLTKEPRESGFQDNGQIGVVVSFRKNCTLSKTMSYLLPPLI